MAAVSLHRAYLSGKELYRHSRSAGNSSLSLTMTTWPTRTSFHVMSVVLPAWHGARLIAYALSMRFETSNMDRGGYCSALTVAVHQVRWGLVGLDIFLVSLHILPYSFHAGHHQYKRQSKS